MAREACNGGCRFIVSCKFSSIEIVSARRSSSIIITFGSTIRWSDDSGCRSWRSSSIIITFGSTIRWSDDGDCRSWRSSLSVAMKTADNLVGFLFFNFFVFIFFLIPLPVAAMPGRRISPAPYGDPGTPGKPAYTSGTEMDIRCAGSHVHLTNRGRRVQSHGFSGGALFRHRGYRHGWRHPGGPTDGWGNGCDVPLMPYPPCRPARPLTGREALSVAGRRHPASRFGTDAVAGR